MNVSRLLSRKHVLLALSASSAAIGRPVATRAAEAFTLRLNVASSPTSLEAIVGQRFATAIARRSNDQLKVEVYPNGQLVSQQDAPAALASGVVDFTISLTSFLTPLFSQYQVFDTPFLFKNPAAAYRVFDGVLGEELFGLLESKGMIGLTWGINGYREIETTSKPIVTPADMKGLRIRIPAGQVYAATFQALGAIPVALDMTELYTGLSQHTVDGQEIPLSSFASTKFYTIAKHVSLSNHMLAVQAIVGSKRKIEALPANLQKIVKEEGRAVAPFMRSLALRQGTDAVQFLRQNGVDFTEVQFAAFRKAVDPVYALIASKAGADLLDRVARIAGSA